MIYRLLAKKNIMLRNDSSTSHDQRKQNKSEPRTRGWTSHQPHWWIHWGRGWLYGYNHWQPRTAWRFCLLPNRSSDQRSVPTAPTIRAYMSPVYSGKKTSAYLHKSNNDPELTYYRWSSPPRSLGWYHGADEAQAAPRFLHVRPTGSPILKASVAVVFRLSNQRCNGQWTNKTVGVTMVSHTSPTIVGNWRSKSSSAVSSHCLTETIVTREINYSKPSRHWNYKPYGHDMLILGWYLGKKFICHQTMLIILSYSLGKTSVQNLPKLLACIFRIWLCPIIYIYRITIPKLLQFGSAGLFSGIPMQWIMTIPDLLQKKICLFDEDKQQQQQQ